MIRRRRRVIIDDTEFYEFLKEEIRENVKAAVTDLLVELKPLLVKGMPANTPSHTKAIKIPDEPVQKVSTSQIKWRWGKSRTTIIKLCKANYIKTVGKYGRQNLYVFDDIVKIFGQPLKD